MSYTHRHRYLLIVGVPGLLALATLFWLFRGATTAALAEQQMAANVTLTRSLSALLGPQITALLAGRPAAIQEFRAALLPLIRGTHIARLKIYDARGLTVFSTNPAQIGETQRDNPGFRSAISGTSRSMVVDRDEIDRFEGALSDRTLVASYIPLRDDPAGLSVGVFEVYTDITDAAAGAEKFQRWIFMWIGGGLTLVYAGVFWVSNRADTLEHRRRVREEQSQLSALHHHHHDHLTRLPNRQRFKEQLADRMAQEKAAGKRFAIVLVDLDNFGRVETDVGYHGWEEAIILIAARLSECVRATDGLFRIGRDQFAFLVHGPAAREQLIGLAERVRAVIRQSLDVGGAATSVTASVGIAVFPDDGSAPASLFAGARAALVRVKSDGGDGYEFTTQAVAT